MSLVEARLYWGDFDSFHSLPIFYVWSLWSHCCLLFAGWHHKSQQLELLSTSLITQGEIIRSLRVFLFIHHIWTIIEVSGQQPFTKPCGWPSKKTVRQPPLSPSGTCLDEVISCWYRKETNVSSWPPHVRDVGIAWMDAKFSLLPALLCIHALLVVQGIPHSGTAVLLRNYWWAY